MKEETIVRLLETWRETFWLFRDDVGIGDDYETESARLEKGLVKLRFDLEAGNPATPRKIRSFILDYRSLTSELETIITQAEAEFGASYPDSEKLNYREYLEY